MLIFRRINKRRALPFVFEGDQGEEQEMFGKNAEESNSKSDQRGFSLIETMIALAIFSIGLLAVASLQITALTGTTKAGKITDATTVATDRIELLSGLDFTDSDLTAGTTHQITTGNCTVVWNITDVDFDADGDTDAKQISMTASSSGRGSVNVSMDRLIGENI